MPQKCYKVRIRVKPGTFFQQSKGTMKKNLELKGPFFPSSFFN